MNSDFWKQFWRLFVEQTMGIYIGDFLIIILLAALVVLIPGYVLYIKKDVSPIKILHIYLTIVYFGVILLFTIIRREAGSRSGRIVTDFDFGMTRTVIYSRMQVIYCLLNIFLFIPFGILLALFRTKQSFFRIVFMSALVGFVTSFCIELTQHITKTGIFEVTDIATNIIGTFAGALLAASLICLTRLLRKKNEK